MEIDVFVKKVCAAVGDELGEGFHVEARDVRKNNGIILHGMSIRREGMNVAPTVYLDTFLEAYEAGATFRSIVQRLLEICKEGMAGECTDTSFFQSFEKVRDRICYRLIGREKNKDMLAEMPYIDFLDLAICFYYAYHSDTLGDGTIPIYNSHMELWETCTAELFGLAKRNTARLFPWTCGSMEDILREMAGGDASLDGMAGEDACLLEMSLKVLSNTSRVHGAVCMLYPGVLDSLARKERNRLYILPSSIHEVILLADDGKIMPDELKKMISEVNSTQVAPEEVLSDSLYYYDLQDKRVRIA